MAAQQRGGRPGRTVDFTSALYLGLGHPSHRLAGWRRLTSGRPAALEPVVGEASLTARLARHLGCPAALVGRSTLHLFHDLATLLAGRPLLVDRGAYPIARWAFAGTRMRTFAHHQPGALAAVLARLPAGSRPLVLCDGLCPTCGAAAPLAAYLAAVRSAGGLLLVDDTQGVGVLGAGRSPARPWGRGGGGSVLHAGLDPARWPELIVVASLAKAYGAPLAVAVGARRRIEQLAADAPSRTHCSPPSAADFAAAHRALDVEARSGEVLRRRLLANVVRLRRRLAALGLAPPGRPFPVQTLPHTPTLPAAELQARLEAAGVGTVLATARCPPRPAVTWLLTAAHRGRHIDHAVAALAAVIGSREKPAQRSHAMPSVPDELSDGIGLDSGWPPVFDHRGGRR